MKKRITLFVIVFLLPVDAFAQVPCCGPTKENAIKVLYASEKLRHYYDMFQCPCCGKPIDTGCCEAARQRKAYLDELLIEDLEENKIVYKMSQKFGYGILKDPAKAENIKEYIRNNAPENPPKIEIDKSKYDFGTISQSEGIVKTMFTMTNAGRSNLIVENLDTSCGCTSVSLVYQGQEGPKFSMSGHGENPKDYQFILPPGDSAFLKVYYDPMAHGKQTKSEEKIIRTVTIISNDPVNFQKTVRIEMTQVP